MRAYTFFSSKAMNFLGRIRTLIEANRADRKIKKQSTYYQCEFLLTAFNRENQSVSVNWLVFFTKRSHWLLLFYHGVNSSLSFVSTIKIGPSSRMKKELTNRNDHLIKLFKYDLLICLIFFFEIDPIFRTNFYRGHRILEEAE